MKDVVVFNGAKYKYRQKTGYYHLHNWGSGYPSTLHRAIWSSVYGPIPPGHHIHHKDGDKLNNSIENLEAISSSEHTRKHAEESDWVGSEANLKQIRVASELAREWHSSDEGIAWHKKHGKATWSNRATTSALCSECQNRFETHFPTRAKFCSSACKERARMKRNGVAVGPRRKSSWKR